MNYPSGFPGTAAVQNTAFIDQNCPSTWNAPPNMPPTWEPASYINSTVSIVTVSTAFVCSLKAFLVYSCLFPTCCLHVLHESQ